VPRQVGLAPAGWSVAGYEDDRALTLASDAAPSISQRLSISDQVLAVADEISYTR
jgi:hypothetical protein